MTDKLFDSFIKQKLEHFESEVPEGLWEKIMPEEKRKPKVFWWFNKTALLTTLAIALAGSSAYLLLNNKTDVDRNRTVAKNNIVTNNNSIENSVPNVTNTINNDLQQNAHHQTIKEKTNTINDIENAVESKFATREHTTREHATREYATREHAPLSDIDDLKHLMTAKKGSKNTHHYLFNKKQNENVDAIKDESLLVSNENKVSNSSSKFLFKDIKNSVVNKSTNSLMLLPTTQLQYNVVANNTLFLTLNNTHKEALIKLQNLFMGSNDCPSAKGADRNDFLIEAYISPDYTFKKVISTTNGLGAYLTQKDSVEIMRGGFSFGARVSKSLTNNLMLKAGLQYTQVNEDFSIKTENERRQTIIINSHTIVRPGQSDTTISDTSAYVQIGYRVQSNANYYRNIEMPILLSYELGSAADKWKLGITAGAIVNVTSWLEGRTVAKNNTLVSINSKAPNTFYKQKMGCSLYGSISIIRTITENIDVFLEPYYRFGISKMESIEGFNQKFNAIGLQIGTRIKLNKNKHL